MQYYIATIYPLDDGYSHSRATKSPVDSTESLGAKYDSGVNQWCNGVDAARIPKLFPNLSRHFNIIAR